MSVELEQLKQAEAVNAFTKLQQIELNKEIRNLIMLGFGETELYQAILGKYEFAREAKDLHVMSYLDIQQAKFQGYDFIQKVKKGIILSPINSKNLYLYDTQSKTKEVVLESQLQKLIKFDWASKLRPCKFEYHPHNNSDIFKSDDGTDIFNTYVPPSWKKEIHYGIATVSSIEIPAVYMTFLKHLFKDDEASINYVLDWLSTGLDSKNQCYLATIGKAGTGKGTLGEIIKALAGFQNYTHVAFKSIKKQFNALLKDKQFIYFDEVQVTRPEEDELLKMLVNDSIEVELKNVDSQILKNYASIYLSSNHLNCLKITADDRRYSITELTEVPFKEAFDENFRLELFKKENISALGIYLLNRSVDFNKMRTPFKSSRTLLAKQSSLKEWEDCFLYTVAYECAGKSIGLDTLDEKTKELTNSSQFKITAKALNKLSETFPGFYTVKRELVENRKLYMVTFKSLEEQPREQLENLEVSELED